MIAIWLIIQFCPIYNMGTHIDDMQNKKPRERERSLLSVPLQLWWRRRFAIFPPCILYTCLILREPVERKRRPYIIKLYTRRMVAESRFAREKKRVYTI